MQKYIIFSYLSEKNLKSEMFPSSTNMLQPKRGPSVGGFAANTGQVWCFQATTLSHVWPQCSIMNPEAVFSLYKGVFLHLLIKSLRPGK